MVGFAKIENKEMSNCEQKKYMSENKRFIKELFLFIHHEREREREMFTFEYFK